MITFIARTFRKQPFANSFATLAPPSATHPFPLQNIPFGHFNLADNSKIN